MRFKQIRLNSNYFNLIRKGIFTSAEGTSGLEAEGQEAMISKGEWSPAGARNWPAKPANF